MQGIDPHICTQQVAGEPVTIATRAEPETTTDETE